MKTAPAMKVAEGSICSHREPAIRLASSRATPLAIGAVEPASGQARPF